MLVTRQRTLEDILDDPAHRFLPEAVTIDRKRTPFRAEVGARLVEAGFAAIAVEPVRVRTHVSSGDWLPEAEPKVCSVFRVISGEAHARGLTGLRKYIAAHPDDRLLLEESMTLFTGRGPECQTMRAR
jgi:hypothetical protein